MEWTGAEQPMEEQKPANCTFSYVYLYLALSVLSVLGPPQIKLLLATKLPQATAHQGMVVNFETAFNSEAKMIVLFLSE